MNLVDDRGCRVSGATPDALRAFERALAAAVAWRTGAERPLAQALQQAPAFVMAHVLRAQFLVCSRDPQRVASARPLLARAAALPANERERLHVAALAAVLADNYEAARAQLGSVLRRWPRDVLALHVVHALDYLAGDAQAMQERAAAVLSAWSNAVPGQHAVLAMHAFALEECGEYELAEQQARAALALNPHDARAHHAMAHVFEMTARPEAGLRWMNAHAACWGVESVVATHGWWHMALFQLELGRPDAALDLYDRRVRAERSSEVADLIDATALLWRVQLCGGDAGPRWAELAAAWSPHIDDAFCSFNDLHAMLAFVGARDAALAQRLEAALSRSQWRPTRHGQTTREVGLPSCRALMAYGRGEHTLAITLLASLPAIAHRFGGSHAQRDLLHLTLAQAIERIGRPAQRPRAALPALAAAA